MLKNNYLHQNQYLGIDFTPQETLKLEILPHISEMPGKLKVQIFFRFTKEEKAKHTAYDWIPFGSGPRSCVAMRLALTEIKIAIVHVLKHYKLLRSYKTEVGLI